VRAFRAQSFSQLEARLTEKASHEGFRIHTSHQVGKYLVSPLTHAIGCGRYAASVSIRSGRGSTTHDRVLRLLPVFDSCDEAARYATTQALAWIDAAASAIPLSSTNQE